MNTIKRRWPDLLIGLLVLLLLGGFATLLLGRSRPSVSQTGAVQSADNSQTSSAAAPSATQSGAAQTTSTPAATTATTPTSPTSAPSSQTAPATGSTSSGASAQTSDIPTIPSSPVTGSPATDSLATDSSATSQPTTNTTPSTTTPSTSPSATDTQTAPAATAEPAARSGGAVATSETRTPTRNDYRISLGSYDSVAAVQAATSGVSRLGYKVYTIPVVSGTVAQVGPFASREAAAQALGDIQRALPGALLYPPRNAPASDSGSRASSEASSGSVPSTTQPSSTQTSGTQVPGTQPSAAQSGTELAASGPVYLQVGAYNSTTAAQSAVSRVRDLGLEPSVNAPAGKLVTVVVGPFQGQALTAAEAKLQAGGIDSFRVR